MEDHRRVVRLLPAFGQIGLNDEGARRHSRTDLMAHKPTVSEAQRRIRLEVGGEMMVKVDGVIPPDTENAPALGLPRFRGPESLGTTQRPRRQGDPRCKTSLEQSPTMHTLDDTGTGLWCFHTSPSFLRRTGGAAQSHALHRTLGLRCATYDTASQLQRQTWEFAPLPWHRTPRFRRGE